MKTILFSFVCVLAFALAQEAVAQMSTSTDTVTAPIISGVSVTNIMGSGAQILWTTDQLSDSRAAYGTSPGSYPYFSNSVCSGGTYVTAHCVNLMNLAPATTYYYKVESMNSSGVDAQTEGFQFTSAGQTNTSSGTSGGGGTTTSYSPASPSNLSATVASSNSIYLSWTDNATNESYFVIARRTSGTTSWAQVATESADKTSHTDSSVAYGSYDYQVAACNSYGCSSPSNIASASLTQSTNQTTSGSTSTTTTPTASVPSAPTGVYATVATLSNTVGIAWTDTSSNEDKFLVSRRIVGGTWVQVGERSANSIGYSDQNVPVGYYYEYAVAACNSYGCSPLATTAQPVYVSANTTTTTISTTSTTSSTVSTATIVTAKGEVDGPSGLPVSGTTLYFSGSSYKTSTVTDSGGKFNVSLYPGVYTVDVIPPYGSLYTKPLPPSITFDQTGGPYVIIPLSLAAKQITGTVSLTGGGAVSNARVIAYSSGTGQWQETLTNSAGSYTLSVGGGSWQVGVKPSDTKSLQWYWNGSPVSISFSSDAASESREINFTVMPANAPLTVIAKDQGGLPIASVGISISTLSASGGSVQNQPSFGTFGRTDVSGTAFFSLPPGTYFVRTGLPSGSGYLELPEQSVTVTSSDTKPLTLIFSKTTQSQTVKVIGRVRLADGLPASAYVYAWSEQGASVSTVAKSDGTFTLELLPNMRWHCGAGKDYNGIPLKAPEITYNVATSGLTLDLVLAPPPQATIFTPTTVSKQASDTIIAESATGAKVTVPPNAVSSSGSVSVVIKPTVEAPQQAAAQLVSTVYDISATDASGKNVSTLASDAEIVIPYDPASLAGKGVSAGNVVPSYFDETTQTWVRVSDYTVDVANKRVILHINHFTRFALIAAADITPPEAPTGLALSSAGTGKIALAWQNPTSDFSHAEVYRSTTSGTLGKLVAAVVETNAYTDEDGLVDKTTYFYTIRAVDAAGNESNNTTQKSVVAIGSSLSTTGALLLPPGQTTAFTITRRLVIGSRGGDVSILQGILKGEGVYPAGLITGYFGPLTKQAVIRFQQKYTTEVLKPYGLSKGTGIVGPTTRAKLNEILSSPG